MSYARTGMFIVIAAGLSLTQAACSKPSTAAASDAATTEPADPIKSAMSAAPLTVAEHATIVASNPDGTMKTLRAGTNAFTCMPDNPVTPGPDPMCMDGNAMKWAMAWMSHQPPPTDVPGVMYMLEGGTDASNTDPFATKPDGDWIKTGPHVMIVGSHAALAGYPSGPQPDTRAPYVMWAGTPYAHLMLPVS